MVREAFFSQRRHELRVRQLEQDVGMARRTRRAPAGEIPASELEEPAPGILSPRRGCVEHPGPLLSEEFDAVGCGERRRAEQIRLDGFTHPEGIAPARRATDVDDALRKARASCSASRDSRGHQDASSI